MPLLSALLLGVGLSMDAFAVSVCKGLAVGKVKLKHMAIAGAWFGGFQALMPLIGYYLGSFFHIYIEKADHWVAFLLLALIGANMLREAFSKEESKPADASFGFRVMLVMAVATSIDALAVGISYAMVPVSIMASATQTANTVLACALTAATTCVISMAGVYIGAVFGARYKKRAEIAGGVILILIGAEIVLRHFGVL